jgi:hypothetical protein
VIGKEGKARRVGGGSEAPFILGLLAIARIYHSGTRPVLVYFIYINSLKLWDTA